MAYRIKPLCIFRKNGELDQLKLIIRILAIKRCFAEYKLNQRLIPQKA